MLGGELRWSRRWGQSTRPSRGLAEGSGGIPPNGGWGGGWREAWGRELGGVWGLGLRRGSAQQAGPHSDGPCWGAGWAWGFGTGEEVTIPPLPSGMELGRILSGLWSLPANPQSSPALWGLSCDAPCVPPHMGSLPSWGSGGIGPRAVGMELGEGGWGAGGTLD